jgi:hypothetical protein
VWEQAEPPWHYGCPTVRRPALTKRRAGDRFWRSQYRNQIELDSILLPTFIRLGCHHGRPTKYEKTRKPRMNSKCDEGNQSATISLSAGDQSERRLPPNHFSWNA